MRCVIDNGRPWSNSDTQLRRSSAVLKRCSPGRFYFVTNAVKSQIPLPAQQTGPFSNPCNHTKHVPQHACVERKRVLPLK